MLTRLAADPALRHTVGSCAREHAEHYRSAAIAPLVLGAYERIGSRP
ncbi:MAG: hypothetical protein U0W40_00590 [Acidimicrobiia bacterium]